MSLIYITFLYKSEVLAKLSIVESYKSLINTLKDFVIHSQSMEFLF